MAAYRSGWLRGRGQMNAKGGERGRVDPAGRETAGQGHLQRRIETVERATTKNSNSANVLPEVVGEVLVGR